MRLLLDTQAFIWASIEPNKLSSKAKRLITNPTNDILLSMASIWEMQIKIQLGKLDLKTPLSAAIEKQRQVNGIQILPIEMSHIFGLLGLPDYHKDPFDRLLIAQARFESIALVTIDSNIKQYSVTTIW